MYIQATRTKASRDILAPFPGSHSDLAYLLCIFFFFILYIFSQPCWPMSDFLAPFTMAWLYLWSLGLPKSSITWLVKLLQFLNWTVIDWYPFMKVLGYHFMPHINWFFHSFVHSFIRSACWIQSKSIYINLGRRLRIKATINKGHEPFSEQQCH